MFLARPPSLTPSDSRRDRYLHVHGRKRRSGRARQAPAPDRRGRPRDGARDAARGTEVQRGRSNRRASRTWAAAAAMPLGGGMIFAAAAAGIARFPHRRGSRGSSRRGRCRRDVVGGGRRRSSSGRRGWWECLAGIRVARRSVIQSTASRRWGWRGARRHRSAWSSGCSVPVPSLPRLSFLCKAQQASQQPAAKNLNLGLRPELGKREGGWELYNHEMRVFIRGAERIKLDGTRLTGGRAREHHSASFASSGGALAAPCLPTSLCGRGSSSGMPCWRGGRW